jgi:hypothetical protein
MANGFHVLLLYCCATIIFARGANSAGTFTLLERITAFDEVGRAAGTGSDEFGGAVAVSGDGYLAVGAHGDDSAGTNSGSVYLFSLDSTTGVATLVEKITAFDASAGSLGFGGSVALSGDGYLAVGAQITDSAYLYSLDSLTGAITLMNKFPSGNVVSFSGNGYLVVGSRTFGSRKIHI